jgi:ABC-type nitrate/sulfonate/bicarbonate transport system ATPase subunit
MVIAAGPSGGGKSTILNVFRVPGVDAFNVDDRAAILYARIQGSPTPIY